MVAQNLWLIRLIHERTGLEVPVELTTVFGRSATYHRYRRGEPRGDRLAEAEETLAAHDYVQIMHDDSVSRTHGLLDPTLPGLADLNSSNGTILNQQRLAQVHGGPGPMASLSHGDTIQVGQQRFHVVLRPTSEESLCGRAAQTRIALVGCDAVRPARGEALERFLKQRKRFATSIATDLSTYVSSAYAASRLAAHDGINVFALCGGVNGTQLRLGPDRFEIGELLTFLRKVPGRKVVALELDGDPTAVERAFRDLATSDMVLLTSLPEVSPSEPLENSAMSLQLNQLRESVDGEGLPGAFDDLVDGLDAMVSPTTNRLNVEWTQGYEGRLRVVFGEHEVGEESFVSHSLAIGTATYRFGRN